MTSEPWNAKKEWREGRITSSNLLGLIFLIVFSSFWNLISFPIAIISIPEAYQKEDWSVFIVLIFPLIGIITIIWMVYEILRYIKYGSSVFEMSKVPGIIGGKLEGKIIAKTKIKPDEGFVLSLICIHQKVTGSGKHRKIEEKNLWQDEKIISYSECEILNKGFSIPVTFGIPFEVKETRDINAGEKILWRLKVLASTPGVDYDCQFEVPVFKTNESKLDFKIDENKDKQHELKLDINQVCRQEKIIIEQSIHGGMTFIPSCIKNIVTQLAFTFFAIFWTAIVAVMYMNKVPSFLTSIFGIFDLIILYGVLDMWLYRNYFEIRGRTLRTYNGYLGFGSVIDLKNSEILEITKKEHSRSGANINYNIIVKASNQNKEIILVRLINSLTHIEYIINFLKKELNLK